MAETSASSNTPGGRSHPFKGRKVKRLAGVSTKVLGHNGLIVGQRFKDRLELSEAGGHAPPTAGIYGSDEDGVYSLVMNGGYKDDQDNGEECIYTGAGGRDRSKGWSGPQANDQEWTGPNRHLKKSYETRNPIRLFRGPQLRSKYAPQEGYKYDGLYHIEQLFRAQGENEKMTCRCHLKRNPGQPPLLTGKDPIPAIYKSQSQTAATTAEPSHSNITEPMDPATSLSTPSPPLQSRKHPRLDSETVERKRPKTEIAQAQNEKDSSWPHSQIDLKVEDEETKPII